MARPRTADIHNREFQDEFLEYLSSVECGGHVGDALRRFQINPGPLYNLAKQEPLDFGQRFRRAKRIGKWRAKEMLRSTMYQRAAFGDVVPVYRKEWMPDADKIAAGDFIGALEASKSTANIIGYQHKPADPGLVKYVATAMLGGAWDQRPGKRDEDEGDLSARSIDLLAASVAAKLSGASGALPIDAGSVKAVVLQLMEQRLRKQIPEVVDVPNEGEG